MLLNTFILIVAAAIPSAVIIFIVYRADSAKPEPLNLIFKSIIYGFVAVIPAFILESLVDMPASYMPFVVRAAWMAFVTAAIIEEGVKYFFLKRYLYKTDDFNEVLDGIVYAVCVSLGFAFAENILYGFMDMEVLILRAFTAVPMHAAASGIMGFWLGMAKRYPHQAKIMQKHGYIKAVIVHGLYDFALLLGSYIAWAAIIVLIGSLLHLRQLIKKAISIDKNSVP